MDKNYYIFKNGQLQRKDNSLIFRLTETDNHKYLPIQDIDAFYLFGEVTLNTKLLNFLAQKEICVHTFNYYGFYTGTFYPKEQQVSGFLLVNQVQHYLDVEKRLTLAKAFVKSAAYTILENLKYYNTRNRDLKETIDAIKALEEKIASADSVESLMGIEGNIRNHYYKTFNAIIVQDIEFKKRVKQPPDNMINSLISFLNTMVYTTCLSEIYKTQLNPTISYLHEPSQRRFSLSLDVAEIFKPLIADRIIFTLLNKKQLTPDDFEKGSEQIFLTDKGRRTVVEAFDQKLNEKVKHRQLKRTVSYRYLIRLELYRLIKHLLDEEPYDGFKVMW